MQKPKEKKEKIDENILKEILNEKIFSKDHIHAIYILFSNLCTESEFKLTRSTLFDLFRRLSLITNIKYEEEKIDLFHLQIDINKDGIITFEDFLRFITTIIKLSYHELYPKKGINLLSSLSLSNDRKFFIDISSSVFANIINYVGGNPSTLNNLNPFSYYDYSLKYLPFYKFYCNNKINININNYYNSQKKFNEFNQMITNFTNENFVAELQNLLKSEITSEYYKGLSLFKKYIKPLNYINTELLVIFFNKNIFIFLSAILQTELLNKVLMIFNIINNNKQTGDNINIISPEVIYTFLTIIKRILNLYVMLNETFLFCSEQKNKFMYHFIKDQANNFNELNIFIGYKILNPLSSNYNFFYEIFRMENKQYLQNERKVKFVMYELILMTSRIKFEYFNYFINSTNYLGWLITDVKNNLNINSLNEIDYITLENVVYNCINIIDIYLKYQNYFSINNNSSNIKSLEKNIYIAISFITNNTKDIIFNENINFALLNNKLNNNNNLTQNSINNIFNNNIFQNDNDNTNKIINGSNLSIKSKFLCLLGLFNCFNVNIEDININNIDNTSQIYFDNRKFILQIYTEEFKIKEKELTLPFYFYLKSLIVNNKNILSLITELDIVNYFFKYYYTNMNNNLITFSQFFDFCDLILQNTAPKILINNSNIINELIMIINKMISENNKNNFKLLEDIEIKNKIIYLLSEITNLNDICINEKILNMKNILNIIISYISTNFYYIEEMNYINKKNIVFNIPLIENGLNIINNIIITNTNSINKILEHFNLQNIEILTNLFDKMCLLWDIEDNSVSDNTPEIIKNKYIFDKYKDLPKKNILIQILSILENLLDFREKIKIPNSTDEQIFNYINEIDINFRSKLRELKISEGETNPPILVVYTQTDEEINQQVKSKFDMEIDGLTFYNFRSTIKEGYQSDVDLSYNINIDNNIVTRFIKTEKDFEVFIQEMIDAYKNKPNKENMVIVDLHVELKNDKPKVKSKCINCGKEIEVELDFGKNEIEDMNNLSSLENLENFQKILNEVNKEQNQFCEDCEKFILEHAKNQINMENSRNNIGNLSGLNLNNLNISNISNSPNTNNTYQNILANNEMANKILNESLLNNSNILSSALLNRTFNTGIRLNNNDLSNINNINNQNQRLNGNNSNINNISAINPINLTTPRRDSSFLTPNLINSSNFNNTFSSSLMDYKIIRNNNFQ